MSKKVKDFKLEVNDLKKVYREDEEETIALDGVNFEIEKGELVSLIGSSGAGKTTLLRCLNGLIKPNGGSILVNGQDVTDLKGKDLRNYQKNVGMIFQQFNLVKRLSVMKNVLVGNLSKKQGLDFLLTSLGIFSEAEKKEACYYLDKVGILENVWKRADHLSGGQQQRVAIAKTMLQSPQFILADEPIASLDPYSSISVMESLQEINREYGTTIIMNMHYLDYAKDFSTRIIGLKHGEVVFDGKPAQLTESAIDKIYSEEDKEQHAFACQPEKEVQATAGANL